MRSDLTLWRFSEHVFEIMSGCEEDIILESSAIAELGLSALFEPGIPNPEIQLVAFKADAQKELNLTLWLPPQTTMRRPVQGEITVTSACLSPHFNGVIGLGFVTFGLAGDSVVDPTNQFHNIKFCSLPLYDPHKRGPRSAWQDSPR